MLFYVMSVIKVRAACWLLPFCSNHHLLCISIYFSFSTVFIANELILIDPLTSAILRAVFSPQKLQTFMQVVIQRNKVKT